MKGILTNHPNQQIKTYQRVIYIIILMASLLWCSGILIAPYWAEKNDFRGEVSGFLYTFYSKSCHQISERSFHLKEYKLGVCSRCTFIYFAFLLAVIIYPLVKKLNNLELPPIWVLFFGIGLVALDAGLDIFDFVKNTFITRELTGAIIGLILPFYIVPGTMRVFDEFFASPKVIPKKHPPSPSPIETPDKRIRGQAFEDKLQRGN